MKSEIKWFKLGVTTCYLICGKDVVLVDTGMPNKLQLFQKKLARLGVDPMRIKLIVLTHSHFDHAGTASDIRRLTGAKIAIHESERDCVEHDSVLIPKGVNLLGKITRPLIFSIRIPFGKFTPDILIGNSPYPLAEYGIDGYIMHTAGHTTGSLSIVLDSGDAIVGCMAHNGFPFRRKPGLPIYAQDINAIKENWKILIDKGVSMVYPGHGNPFPVEVMKRALN